MCALARTTTRTPFVYRQISESRFWARSTARRLRVQAALRLASRVVTLWAGSAHTLEDDFGVSRAKLRIVPNGVPQGRFPPVDRANTERARTSLGVDPTRPTILSIGALVPEKGVDLAIRATAKLEDAQLLVAGDGPERAGLESLATRQAPERVRFVGSLADPRPCFEAADVLVLPSRGGDSMPAVLIEAGFMGVPAVATPVDGIVEILDHGQAGELVPGGDIEQLADVLRTLLSDHDRARRLAEAARTHCLAEYDIDVVATKWERVIDEVALRD
jgi:glycosyltransferase involved in cell wall biosynthesis